MWKLSWIVLPLITFGNSSSQDHPGTTEISRNFRNYENQFQGYRSIVKSVEYVEEGRDRRDAEDYLRSDSDEFVDEDLIGKWRNSGSALEPKWRDGDSLPLVPFDDSSRRKKLSRQDTRNEDTRFFLSSRHTEKLLDPENPKLSRIRVEDEVTMTKIPVGYADRDSTVRRENGERNYDSSDIRYDDSRGEAFSQRERRTEISGAGTSVAMPKAAIELTRNSHVPMERTENKEELTYAIESDASKMRYVDAFQTRANEYEMNDEEYEKPRPRKRRPPQNYEFVETRPPTYSITWSTETYVETTSSNLDELSPTTGVSAKSPDPKRRSGVNGRENARASRRRNKASRRGSGNAELKSLLKMQQIEGLSPSELLQRRNFTLNDLLRGKEEVLNVLKMRADENSDEAIGVRPKFFEPKKLDEAIHMESDEKRQSNQSVVRVDSNSNEITTIARTENYAETLTSTDGSDDENSDEKIDSIESSDAIGRSTSSSENEKFSAIVRLAKPIILPRRNILSDVTSPRYEELLEDSLVSYRKNDSNFGSRNESSSKRDDDEIMEFSDFTVRKVETTTSSQLEPTSKHYESKFIDDSESTLSIENILSSTQKSSPILPANGTKVIRTTGRTVTADVSNSKVFRFLPLDYQSDEPDRKSDNDDHDEAEFTFEEEATSSDAAGPTKVEKISITGGNGILQKNHSTRTIGSDETYELVVSEVEPEARAEIFELFSTGSSAKRLERLLKARNMSIDELIELRQRGSSRVHLAEILRSRDNAQSRNSKPSDETGAAAPKVTTMTKITNVPERTDAILTDPGADGVPKETIEKNTNIPLVGTETTRTFATEDESQQSFHSTESFDALPFSEGPFEFSDRREATSSAETELTSDLPDEIIVGTTPKNLDYPTHRVVIGLVEQIPEETGFPIGNDLAERETRANYSIVAKNGGKTKHLSKVRPSIIASGAILGVTVVVFLAIFLVCRIRQKQKYTYRNNFGRSVFQTPATTVRKLSNCSSLNTIMVNVVATSTNKRPERRDNARRDIDENFESRSDIENDSLDDANDSWETIPDFMK